MMKGNKTVFSLLLVMGLVLCLSTGVWAVSSDDFSDGIADGWTVVSGDWSVQPSGADFAYIQSNMDYNNQTPYGWDNISLATLGSTQSDYVIQADMKLEEVNYSGWWGLVFRYQNISNYYTITFYTTPSGTSLEFWTYINNVWTLAGYAFVTVDPYAWNTLKADIKGNVFDFYLNGGLVLSSTDSSIASGDAGLYSEISHVSFDNWNMPAPLSTIGDLINAIPDFLASGLISNRGIANSLIAKLNNALNAPKDTQKIQKLQTFINQVQALSGNQIEQATATLLINAANGIIAGLQ